MVSIKSDREIEIMREAGEILARIFEEIKPFVKSGIRTGDIDLRAEELMKARKVEPAFKGYRGFPACVCTSVNEEVVHGIPSDRRLKEGDLLSLDMGIKWKGFYADSARSWIIGRGAREAERLIQITRDAFLKAALPKLVAGNRLGDVSHTIQTYVEERGLSVVRDFVGHGIGRELHEDPQVPNFGSSGRGIKLEEGMVLAIEPMVTTGGPEVTILDDHWTVITADGSLACHYEDTVAITDNGPEILTIIEAASF